MNDQGAVVVFPQGGALRSQTFDSSADAERFACTVGPWAVVVVGDEREFCGMVSVGGEYPFPAFGGAA